MQSSCSRTTTQLVSVVTRRFWRSSPPSCRRPLQQQRQYFRLPTSLSPRTRSFDQIQGEISLKKKNNLRQRQVSLFSSSAFTKDTDKVDEGRQGPSKSPTQSNASQDKNEQSIDETKTKRIWRPNGSPDEPLYWSDDVVQDDPSHLAMLLDRIEKQELEGGRMKSAQYGVLHEDPVVDMRLLTENYTVTSLASALRDREDMLQHCAQLAAQNDITTLKEVLSHHHPDFVLQRRSKRRQLDVSTRLNATSLETIRKALMRMPRRVTQAHTKRAGVVICLCHVNGVPSLLLEKRSASLRAHPDEVCLPGGMVCNINDRTIVETCLREMKEEIGGLDFDHHHPSGRSGMVVLGVLRCNWGEVHHMVGVAVTPVVCVLGEDLGNVNLRPNPDEVAEVFTIPLSTLMDKSQWIHKDDHAPIFLGGPYMIWGLTGYILERFWKDVLMPFHIKDGTL